MTLALASSEQTVIHFLHTPIRLLNITEENFELESLLFIPKSGLNWACTSIHSSGIYFWISLCYLGWIKLLSVISTSTYFVIFYFLNYALYDVNVWAFSSPYFKFSSCIIHPILFYRKAFLYCCIHYMYAFLSQLLQECIPFIITPTSGILSQPTITSRSPTLIQSSLNHPISMRYYSSCVFLQPSSGKLSMLDASNFNFHLFIYVHLTSPRSTVTSLATLSFLLIIIFSKNIQRHDKIPMIEWQNFLSNKIIEYGLNLCYLKCWHGSGRSSGAGTGNPLQYSCLENFMDRGAWRATVHGVAESQTQLSD